MKIGKETNPITAISTSNSDTIIVRGKDLCNDLIGKLSFTEYFYLLLTGKPPTELQTKIIDATLLSIAEHGLVPSVQASRMTLSAAPDAFQGAVAAGILGCGSVILGAAESSGKMFIEINTYMEQNNVSCEAAVDDVLKGYREKRIPIPGYGHPLHKERDPRTVKLLAFAKKLKINSQYMEIAEAVEAHIPTLIKKELPLNVSGVIPAVLLGVDFPVAALKGIPILARTAGLIAHLTEELERPIGFALSYNASKDASYDGDIPTDFNK